MIRGRHLSICSTRSAYLQHLCVRATSVAARLGLAQRRRGTRTNINFAARRLQIAVSGCFVLLI